MRLLHTESLELHAFEPTQAPDYVILSHRWASPATSELTFADISRSLISPLPSLSDTNTNTSANANANILFRHLPGFTKVKGACDKAAADGYDYIWIDSCCIDRSSSADLQEAINSMWDYYARANICYVYMADVADRGAGWSTGEASFAASEWFTRGWTLQELIAPRNVEFYAADWAAVGTKSERYREIAGITGVSVEMLAGKEGVEEFSAAERMSWAAHRRVTRAEDEAYALWGLFQVNMPMLYGEGRERAFFRLQEAIYNSTTDQSLFLFRYSRHRGNQPLLADCPSRFCQREQCRLCSGLTQCFPAGIPYTELARRQVRRVEAHEPIMTTVATDTIETSVKLSVIAYDLAFSRLLSLEKSKRRRYEKRYKVLYEVLNKQHYIGQKFYFAVLNCMSKNYVEEALCFVLYRPQVGEGFICWRPQEYPIIIPCTQEFARKIERLKTVVSSPSFSDHGQATTVTFSLVASNCDEFLVPAWSTNRVTEYAAIHDIERSNTELVIRTTKNAHVSFESMVWCRVVLSQDPGVEISLQLAQVGEAWWIDEVRVIGSSTSGRMPIACDRCSVVLKDGRTVSVGLRRLAASCRPQPDSTTIGIPQLRYQIRLELL